MVPQRPPLPGERETANPVKAGDAKLRGYRTRSRVTPVEPPNLWGGGYESPQTAVLVSDRGSALCGLRHPAAHRNRRPYLTDRRLSGHADARSTTEFFVPRLRPH